MTKIIQQSIKLANELFSESYDTTGRYRAYHFSFLYERNKLLSIGQNNYEMNAKALKFAKKFGVYGKIEHCTLHSEISCIARLWGRVRVGPNLTLVNLRISKKYNLCNSRPCSDCFKVLQALDIHKIYYSDSEGNIVKWTENLTNC